jgi:uncharacterized protein YggU (UPF0235/DUF167 family)
MNNMLRILFKDGQLSFCARVQTAAPEQSQANKILVEFLAQVLKARERPSVLLGAIEVGQNDSD